MRKGLIAAAFGLLVAAAIVTAAVAKTDCARRRQPRSRPAPTCRSASSAR